MIVVGLDPGYRESALVCFDGAGIVSHQIDTNERVMETFRTLDPADHVLVIEEMQLFGGHHVGKEVFDSVFWSGRFAQAWLPGKFERILRARVRSHFGCNKGGDAAIRQALIDRFGPFKEDAIGSKAKPGPLYKIRSHEWSALAIAVVWWDQHCKTAATADEF